MDKKNYTIMNNAPHILIVEDHELMRQGYRLILHKAVPQCIIEESGNAAGAIQKLHSAEDWALVILDIDLPGQNGLSVLQAVRSKFPQTRTLIISMHEESEYGIRAIKSGANAYLSKSCSSEVFHECVLTLLKGENYITPSLGNLLAKVVCANESQRYGYVTLTTREHEVIDKMIQGSSLTDIAHEMSLSVKTISTYKTRAFEKLGFKTNAELIRWAIEEKKSMFS